ncbi:unnamed protein product [Camellia sinensis]
METISRDSEYGFVEMFRRETGSIHPRTFARRISASEVLVNQIDLYGKLNGHAGCINTVQFYSTGDLLVSGSDDRQVMFWNWAMKKLEFSYPSGHLDNIFQVRIMPFTDDRKTVTSSADGQASQRGYSRIMVTPDVIMRVLQLHRRQALTYIQSRYNTADVEGDEEDEFITAFSGDASSEDGNSRECSIS